MHDIADSHTGLEEELDLANSKAEQADIHVDGLVLGNDNLMETNGLSLSRPKATWTRINRMDFGLGGLARALTLPSIGKRDSRSDLDEDYQTKKGRIEGCSCREGCDVEISAGLMEHLVDRLSIEEMELFWVQCWLIWNQRNCVLYGGQLKHPTNLNKRAEEFLEEFKHAQVSLDGRLREQRIDDAWQPPPPMEYKLNFDAAIFSGQEKSGIGAIIRNDKGEVMAGMSAIGPKVDTSEEAELLACRRSIEFAVDAGFTRLVIEGDNSNVMQAISSNVANYSFLGNVVDDIRHLMSNLQWTTTSKIRRGVTR
ncbi:hypothetical protein SO802_031962 [Lithocarpus litseifolius]|uniref:RNase H type-1 domain-containing protein n=1 Tax=Lithocarpus litseifolius TaxID=425828 RepID=A0AAW2BNS2_9ROSI